MVSDDEKKELIELARKIIEVEGSEEDINNMIIELQQRTGCPEITNYIFYPKNEGDVTPVKVVEKALAYKPNIINL